MCFKLFLKLAVTMLLLVFLCGFKELHAFSVTLSFIQRAREYFFPLEFSETVFSLCSLKSWKSLQSSCLVKKSLLTVVSRPSAALRSAERSAAVILSRQKVYF